MSGCGFDVYKLPLPGGTDVGDHPITVHVMFHDVLDLVPQSTVKVNDVNVGKVTDVSLDGYTADVTVQLRNDVRLPDNAVATIRQTSLLGEKFVSLAAPDTGASSDPLQTGDVIPLERSGRNPEVEEVLGALSLLLNGGGVAQLRTIAQQLNLALDGREGTARSVLDQVRTLMTQLDDHKAEIVNAIDKLNDLSVSINRQRDTIDATLDKLPSALASINQQRRDLVTMLRALAHLSDVGVRVISASKAATIDSLQQLDPVLSQIAASGDDFVNAFSVFLTYPFVDEVVGRDPQVARNLHMGDYTNLSVTLDVNVDTTLPTAADRAAHHGTSHAADQPAHHAAHDHRPDRGPQRRARLHQERQPHQPGVPEGAGQSGEAARAPCRVRQAGEQGPRRLPAAQHAAHPADAERLRPVADPEHPHPDAADPPPAAGHGPRAPRLRQARADDGPADAALRPGARQPPRAGPGHLGRGSPMITRRTRIQLVAFTLITLIGVSFVGARYARLDRMFVDTSYTVVAHFADSGGIFAGGEVSYRGVRVGQVEKLELTDAGVDVYLDIDNDLRRDPRRHPRPGRQPLGRG